MADIESRAAVLEAAVANIQASLARIEETVVATKAQVDFLRGRIEGLPTTWQMIVAIVGGQVALASLMAAIVFGAAHVMGKV